MICPTVADPKVGWLCNWTRTSLSCRVHPDSMNGIQTVDLLPEREPQQLSFKDGIKLPVTDVNVNPRACFTEDDRRVGVRSSDPAFDSQEDSASPNEQSSEEDVDSCSTDDSLKHPGEDSDSESSSSSDSVSDSNLVYRPHFRSHGNQPLKAQLSSTERASLQDRGEKTRVDGGGRMGDLYLFVFKSNKSEIMKCSLVVLPDISLTLTSTHDSLKKSVSLCCVIKPRPILVAHFVLPTLFLETVCHKETSESCGRVAQLKKAFADDPHKKSPPSNKPPIPAKPAHLQKRSQPWVSNTHPAARQKFGEPVRAAHLFSNGLQRSLH